MSLLTTKRTFSQFQASYAQSARLERAGDELSQPRDSSIFPLQRAFPQKRSILRGRTLGQQGVFLIGNTPHPAYKSEIIVKIDQPLKRLRILFPKMSENQLQTVLDRTNDIDEAIRALSALSISTPPQVVTFIGRELESDEEQPLNVNELDHIIQSQRRPLSPTSSQSESEMEDQNAQFLDPEFYVSELVKLGVEDTFLRTAFYRFKQQTDQQRKREKDKLLKLLGKQRKDNILMKKILSVQIEKERVSEVQIQKYKEQNNKMADLETEVGRRGDVIWQLQREREELLRLLGGASGSCGKPVMSQLPDVC